MKRILLVTKFQVNTLVYGGINLHEITKFNGKRETIKYATDSVVGDSYKSFCVFCGTKDECQKYCETHK